MEFSKLLLSIAIFSFCILGAKAQEITMFPGFFDYRYYQDDERINKKDLRGLLETNEESIAHWKKSRTLNGLAVVALGAEFGFLVWQLDRAQNNESQTGPVIGAVGSGVIAIVLAMSSIGQKKKAILKYNKGLDQKTSLKILPSKTGIGIALAF